MDKMREALRRWHYEKSEAHDQLDFPKPALNLSSAEGFEAGYTIATAESQQTIAAQQQQIVAYREAMLSVLCDPEGSPCFEGSDGDREVIRQALAQPFDTSALERYRKEVLSQSLEYERGYTEGLKIGQELRRMAKGE